ncbi:MAG TPA: YegS/Rv2252/BmrU family lipid kinase [Thermoanaerobaculia bacterium]|nr:YegS/Rv2252/BmrU family lipid kinase [Thermoanaerobaculia bacterium]
MKVLFLINARSGRQRDFDIADVIREHCGEWQYEIVACQRKEDVDGIIDGAERDGYDVVYAVGGDGTVHETAKRLVNRNLALGILPTGSGNGFARHIQLPMAPAASVASCRGGRVVTIDTAEVNGIRFLGIMGIGFDAVVADRFASSNVRGLQTYVKDGLRAYAEYEAEEYDLVVDGTPMRRSAFILAIANSSQYGNEARVAPHASVLDGKLDLVLIDNPSLFKAPVLLSRLFRGTFDRSSGVTSMQVRELTIRRKSAGPAHLDGEPFTLPEELVVRVVPQSLRVLVPDAARGF